MSENRRAILEGILHSDDTTPMEKLKAEELLQELDRIDPSGMDREFFADLRRLDESGALPADDLREVGLTQAEIDGWFAPVLTVEERVEREADERAAEILASNEKFNTAVEAVSRDMVRERLREINSPPPVKRDVADRVAEVVELPERAAVLEQARRNRNAGTRRTEYAWT